MNFKNDAIKNPDAREISDAKMRCLVKTIAMFGLGARLYDGTYQPSTIDSKTSSDDEKTEEVLTPLKSLRIKKQKSKEMTLNDYTSKKYDNTNRGILWDIPVSDDGKKQMTLVKQGKLNMDGQQQTIYGVVEKIGMVSLLCLY